jgi:hypothetical protein
MTLAYGSFTPPLNAALITGNIGWNFIGWSPVVSTQVTGNATYVAQWSQIPNPTTYTVIFVDWDGTVISTQAVVSGGSATPPTSPTRSGYTFNGWDTAFTNITADTTVTATYTLIPVNPNVPGLTPATPPVPPATAPPVVPVVVPEVEAPATTIPDAAPPLAAPTTTPDPPASNNDEPLTIADEETPLAAPIGAWALVNLILAILSFVIFVALAIHLVTGRRRKDDKDNRY